jgi:hypothetical protein
MTIPLASVAMPAQLDVLRPIVCERACVVVGSAPLKTPAADVAAQFQGAG